MGKSSTNISFLIFDFFFDIVQFLKHTTHAYSVHFEHFLCEIFFILSIKSVLSL